MHAHQTTGKAQGTGSLQRSPPYHTHLHLDVGAQKFTVVQSAEGCIGILRLHKVLEVVGVQRWSGEGEGEGKGASHMAKIQRLPLSQPTR